MGSRVFISAGEASGDLYAAGVVEALKARRPDLEFFGCAGPRMRRAGVEAVVDSASLAVVGLVEVLRHLPRIYGEYRKLLRAIRRDPPQAAILTDSPDFHLRLAGRLKRLGVPVIYLVAPQVWAWRKGRLRQMRRVIDRLLCIFPFEEEFFVRRGLRATYIGHPLARLIRTSASTAALRRELVGDGSGPLIALLPGSRPGEALRHLPALLDAAGRLQAHRKARFILALPEGFEARANLKTFRERFSRLTIQVLEGRTWDVLACADLALAASGTVTIEAALLGAPMIAFYRVNRMSWLLGKLLVRVPFYSMVNLIAGRRVAPELIQNQMTGERLAAEAGQLLDDENSRARMREDLAMVARRLTAGADPSETAASVVEMFLKEEMAHVL